jgi:predicted phage terminase large subunit-like protein
MQPSGRRSKPTAEDWSFSRLAPFSAMMNPELSPAAHHRHVCRKLEAVERGEIKRLMVFLPPGSAKSHYANVMFSAWYMGRNPKSALLVCSANGELAGQWGRRVRNIVAQPVFRQIFGTGLSLDNAAADRWATTHGGLYFAAGVGSTIVGRRADLAVLDDPVADRQHADNPNEREKLWQWYRWDFWTRLKPGASVVLIMTRWNEDDLAGRLLADMAAGGEAWDVISIPALAEEADPLGRAVGEPLWQEWFRPEMFVEAQRNARSWSALYQQKPLPETGDYFKREWFHSYDRLPDRKTLRIYGGSDYAVTADGGDFTCHVVVALDPDGRLYLVDVWRGQTDSAAWVEAFCDLVIKWKPMGWAEETGQIRSGVGPWLTRRQRERGAYVHREVFPTRGDKSIRSQSFRGRAALDGVYMPTGASWAPQVLAELLGFPASAHDDTVDALGLVGQLLDVMLVGTPAKAQPLIKRDAWDKAFKGDDDVADSWKVA